MINHVSLQNFKCHQEETHFDLKQINLLTGINGKGKSTFLQSFLLLGQLIYRELETGYYWYYDSFHSDSQEKNAKILIELEICDAQGNHIGTADAQTGIINVENRVSGRSIKRYLS